MCAFVTNFEEFSAFIYGFKHFREGTPNRWELVAEFVRGQASDLCRAVGPTVCIGKRGDGVNCKGKCLDLKNIEECRLLSKLLRKNYPFLISEEFDVKVLGASGRTANKAIILLPPTLKCCGNGIKMDNGPSFHWYTP